MTTLISGGEISDNFLIFDASTYHVFDAATGEDLTYEIKQGDKVRLFDNFDRATDNERAYVEKYKRDNGTAPPPVGSTSTFVHFWNQITTDPLQAPIAAALGQGSSGPGLGENSTAKILKAVAVFAAVALTLYAISTFTKAAAVAKA